MTTPEQAPELLNTAGLFTLWQAYCEKKEQCEYLTEQLELVTKERDECRRQSDLQMNSAIKFCQERNEARIERDELNVHVKLLQNNNISRCANFELLTKERDTLEAAAKLALSALNMSKIYVSVHGWDDEIDQVYNTIESLRRVGVQ